MKLDEHRKSVEVYDAHCINLLESLDDLDPKSEEYAKVQDALGKMEKTKQDALDGYVKMRDSLVPDFAVNIGAIGVSFLGTMLVLWFEHSGDVIGSTAASLIRKMNLGR